MRISINGDGLIKMQGVYQLKNNLFCQQKSQNTGFEEHYLKVRATENRVYSIQELKNLPRVPKTSPHYSEWKIRQKSASKMISYLMAKSGSLRILELGCGNGWLVHALSAIKDSRIIGLDINLFELKQASEAFEEVRNVTFLYGDIYEDILLKGSFDIIVLAASIQYFNDIEKLLKRLFELLDNNKGEIHIIDSPLYNDDQLSAAATRSARHYDSLGHPELKNYYFHHSHNTLRSYNFRKLYNASSIQNKILRKFIFKDLSPFSWIQVSNKDIHA